MQLSSQTNRSNTTESTSACTETQSTSSANESAKDVPSYSSSSETSSSAPGLPRSISDTKIRQGRPNLTLPLPSVTSLMHFKVFSKRPSFEANFS